MSPDATVISALDATCRAQHSVITAAEASAEVAAEELPVFTEQNVHVNGDLRVAIMLPVACRPVRRLLSVSLCLCLSASPSASFSDLRLKAAVLCVLQIAARYLVIALAQTALGRLAQRWADASDAAALRASILEALRPWSAMPAPRIRKDNGRAIFQLCAALASSAATPPSECRTTTPPSTFALILTRIVR
eukprot:COSAG04_NODE_3832_length_2487_cov_1.260050_1_plen_191_part_10